jgi:hypothetical protein
MSAIDVVHDIDKSGFMNESDLRTPTVTEIKKQEKSIKSKKESKKRNRKKSDVTVNNGSVDDELIKNIRASRKYE